MKEKIKQLLNSIVGSLFRESSDSQNTEPTPTPHHLKEKGYMKTPAGWIKFDDDNSGNYTFIYDSPEPDVKGESAPEVTPTPLPTQPSSVDYAMEIARNPNVSKYGISDSVKSAIEGAAKEYNIPSSLLYDIALQESSFNPKAEARLSGFEDSTAKGLFMFNDPTWDTVQNYLNMAGSSLKLDNTNRMDPNTSAKAAAYLISKGQLGRWDASKNVWGKHYNEEELKPYYNQTLR